MDDPGEVKTSSQLKTDNEEEEPFMSKYTHLLLMAKSPDHESDEEELSLSSSEEVVKLSKTEFLIEFQNSMT